MKDKKMLLLVIFLFLAIIFQSLSAIKYNSLGGDEEAYIPQGYYYVHKHDFNIANSWANPALPYYIMSIFLLNFDINDSIWTAYPPLEIGSVFVFNSGYDAERILFAARLPMVLVSILLGFFVYKWARKLYGPKAGLLALFLYAFSPNIIAFSSLAHTDIVNACFVFIAAYSFWMFLEKPSKRRLLISGATLGLALLSKSTALLLPPIFFIILLIDSFYYKNKRFSFGLPFKIPNKKSILSRLYSITSLIVILVVVAFLVMVVFYQFQFKPLATGIAPDWLDITYNYIDRSIQNEDIKKSIFYFMEEVPIPFPTYWYGLAQQFTRANTGHPNFLMGIHSHTGWRYYYLISFFIKTPIPTIILLILTLIFFSSISHKNKLNELFLVLPIVIFFTMLSMNKAQDGLRYILPIYPFLFVFVSKAINIRIKKQMIMNILIVLLSLWYLFSALSISPHYLSYFNELIGGPNNGYKYTVDSNLDLGQDIKHLKTYMVQNNINSIKLNYFGPASNIGYYNISHEILEPENDYAWNPTKKACLPTDGLIAISATSLQSTYNYNKTCFDWLKQFEPIDRMGYSIFIYNITYCEGKPKNIIHGKAVKTAKGACMI